MIEFRDALFQRVNDIIQPAVGIGSDPTEFVRKFDKRLKDFSIDPGNLEVPALVIAVRTTERLEPGEIGVPFNKYVWTVHFYYLDMETVEANYDRADTRRNHILARLEKTLEQNFLLPDPVTKELLSTRDSDGHTERTYSSSIQAITWDQSGEEGYESFVSELIFEVYTDRF